MKAKCELDPDINKCPHYESVEQECNSDNSCCGFYRIPNAESIPKYFRQPRWYEQYYKKR